MIRLDGVTKVYRTWNQRTVVLNDVSVVLDTRKSYGVLGLNGAGKSTLLRLIAGTEMPTRGSVTRRGRISWPLGFAGGFHPKMTGRDNIAFISRAYGADIPSTIEFVDDFSELGSFLDAPVRTYSSGMQARLAFGMSMAINFDCYLIDEITAVGDARFQLRCVQAFDERRQRSGIIMASHGIGTIKEYCQHGIVMYNKKIVVFEYVDEAIEFYKTQC
jgi:capsular polysaccharide transport system ATP-binding protein